MTTLRRFAAGVAEFQGRCASMSQMRSGSVDVAVARRSSRTVPVADALRQLARSGADACCVDQVDNVAPLHDGDAAGALPTLRPMRQRRVGAIRFDDPTVMLLLFATEAYEALPVAAARPPRRDIEDYLRPGVCACLISSPDARSVSRSSAARVHKRVSAHHRAHQRPAEAERGRRLEIEGNATARRHQMRRCDGIAPICRREDALIAGGRAAARIARSCCTLA